MRNNEKRRPLWKARIPVSERRNLNLTMWPPFPGSEIKTPQIVFDEGRVNEKGEWEHTRISLPVGRLLEIAEQMRQAWLEYKRQVSE